MALARDREGYRAEPAPAGATFAMLSPARALRVPCVLVCYSPRSLQSEPLCKTRGASSVHIPHVSASHRGWHPCSANSTRREGQASCGTELFMCTEQCTARPQMTKLGCVGVRIRNVQLGFTGTVGNQSRTAGWTERLIGKISHSNE